MHAVKILGERAAVAFQATLFPLVCLGAVGALSWKISDAPSVLQLTGLGIFAMFAIVMTWIRRR